MKFPVHTSTHVTCRFVAAMALAFGLVCAIPGTSAAEGIAQVDGIRHVGAGRKLVSSQRVPVHHLHKTAVHHTKKLELAHVPHHGVPLNVPEFDPNAAGSALVLLLGGTLLLTDRRRRDALA